MQGRTCALALAFLAPTLSAQSVLTVDDDGPADFADVQSAINVAASGDVVLVHPGDYPPFSINGKGLVVHRATSVAPSFEGPVRVLNVPASESVTLRGLVVNYSANPFTPEPVLQVADCDGNVWIEEVNLHEVLTLPGFVGLAGSQVTNCASVAFARCELRAITDFLGVGAVVLNGLRVIDSTVALFECMVRGGTGPSEVQIPGSAGGGEPGLLVDSSSVFLSGCSLFGGSGNDGNDFITCQDCSGGDAAPAVRVEGESSSVEAVSSTLTAGLAGGPDGPGGFCSGVICTRGERATPTVVLGGTFQSEPSATPRSLVSDSPIRDGETIVETYSGEPGDLVVAVFSLGQSPAVFLPDVVGPGFIANPAFFLTIGVLGASGQATFQLVNSGILDPGFSGIPLFKQAVHADAGGDLWIGSPSVLLLLNPPF